MEMLKVALKALIEPKWKVSLVRPSTVALHASHSIRVGAFVIVSFYMTLSFQCCLFSASLSLLSRHYCFYISQKIKRLFFKLYTLSPRV